MPVKSDLTFFSLLKMFPFSEGGSLIIHNKDLNILPERAIKGSNSINPFLYDINAISRKRKENYTVLMSLMSGNDELFVPLKRMWDIEKNVPQTFPIIIKRGNRNKIYEIMNEQGYGVVSLYHTMIEELKIDQHADACWLSGKIMNLPVHQDCDSEEYPKMVEALKLACECT
jgi:dTDP-4-amino-4,6-dideoxygalactose transaminase